MTTLAPVPVTVVAGFLGAGKTTLLNHLLNNAHGRRLAILVNDFGELDIDRSLIAEVTADVQALTNGCICCSMQGDLIDQIGTLAGRQPAPDHIVIECSGVSDPARIARTLGYPELQAITRLDSILTVVDPTTLDSLTGDHARLARGQIAAADLLVLNKTDLVARGDLDALRARWLAPHARAVEAVAGAVEPELVFDDTRVPAVDEVPDGELDTGDAFRSGLVEYPGAFRLAALRAALDRVPAGVFRIKGAVWLAERPGEPFWLQWVGGRTDLRPAVHPHATETNRLVILSDRDVAVQGTVETLLMQSLDGARAAGEAR